MKKWMLIMLSLLLLMTAGCGKEDIPDLPATITPGALQENSDSDTVEDTPQLSPDGDTAEDGEDTAPPVTEDKGDADEEEKDEKPSEEENAHKGEDTEAGMVTVVRAGQPANALSSMVVTVLLKTTSRRLAMPRKAFSGTLVMPSPMTTFVTVSP